MVTGVDFLTKYDYNIMEEKMKRIRKVVMSIISCILAFSIFCISEQAGSTLNFFANVYGDGVNKRIIIIKININNIDITFFKIFIKTPYLKLNKFIAFLFVSLTTSS